MKKETKTLVIIGLLIASIGFIGVLAYLKLTQLPRAKISLKPVRLYPSAVAFEVTFEEELPILRMVVYYYFQGNLTSIEGYDLFETGLIYLRVGDYGDDAWWYSHLIIYFEDFEGWQKIRVDIEPSAWDY